ncbi:hypothetical protein BH09ACT1_BH09ACT1_06640 [soil metagenome]
MRRTCRSALVVVATLTLTLLGVLVSSGDAYAAEDPSITIPQGSATAEVGNIIVIAVLADDLVDLYAYTLEFTFDPALIEFVSATDPPDIDGFGQASVLPDGRTVRYLHTALGSSPTASGSAVLVRMRFRLLGVGSTTIDFASAEFVDSTGGTTSQDGVGAYAITAVPDAASTGGLSAAATDTADGTASVGGSSGSGSTHDPAPEADGLAGTGVSPLAAIVLGAGCLLAGGLMLIARWRVRWRPQLPSRNRV